MTPIFLFIGIGVFLSLDIIQPSMFLAPERHINLLIAAGLTGLAPIYLLTIAIQHLMSLWKPGKNGVIWAGIALCTVFMFGEVIYSYSALQGVFGDAEVPLIKTLGILFLPFTFSLFYFFSLFFESKPKSDPEPIELFGTTITIDDFYSDEFRQKIADKNNTFAAREKVIEKIGLMVRNQE
jgi:hypothetical protein